MTATEIIQLLLLLDQMTAKVTQIIDQIGDMSEADEATLKELLAKQRARNDEQFAKADAVLAARAGS